MPGALGYHFETVEELVRLATDEGLGIGEVALCYEMEQSAMEQEALQAVMRERWRFMVASMDSGLGAPQATMGRLCQGLAPRMRDHRPIFLDSHLVGGMARAMAVNECSAAMRRIVAAPTAGSSGILPAALWMAMTKLNSSEEQVVNALFVAGALGMVIANSASISGAKHGCMAEVGVSTAMAAGALVELAGGSPQQVGHGLALALKNTLGLVCDPVGGYVEVPCVKRNAIFALHALAAAELALAGIESFVPPDQVISAMRDIGESMPTKLKETSLGGLAATTVGMQVMQARHSFSTP